MPLTTLKLLAEVPTPLSKPVEHFEDIDHISSHYQEAHWERSMMGVSPSPLIMQLLKKRQVQTPCSLITNGPRQISIRRVTLYASATPVSDDQVFSTIRIFHF